MADMQPPPPPDGYVMQSSAPPPPPPGYQIQSASVQPKSGDIVVRPTADQLDDAKPGFFDGAGRQLSMSAHSLAQSIPGVVDLVTAIPRAAINYGEEKFGADPKWRVGSLGDTASAGLTAVGVPNYQPQGSAENFVQAVNRGVGGAVGGVGTGAALSTLPAGTISTAGNIMASNPLLQAASATTGSLSAEGAKQAGAGPVGQIAAGLVGGLIPVAPAAVGAGVKASIRGSDSNIPKIQQNIVDFANAGTSPTVGQATQSPIAQGAESLLSKTPGAVNVMKTAAQNQADQIANQTGKIADTLSPNADSGAAGQAIIRGVTGPGGFVENFKTTANDLYNKLDNYLPSSKPVDITKTQQALADINGGTPGAPSTSALMQNPKLVKLEQAIQTDAPNGQLPYEALKQVRSMIGDQLSDFSLTSDVPRGKLKALYGALSDDMQTAAKSQGPDAAKAWDTANQFYKAGQDRLDTLQRIVDKNGGPEAVFNAAMSGTKEGNTTISNVMGSLPAQEQRVLSAAVVNRLGKATPGQQNAAGDEFSTNTFLTNWNNLSPRAKDTLFGGYGKDFVDNLNSVANVASNIRSGAKYLSNPSGTSPSLAALGTVSGFITSALTGHPGAAAAIAGAAGGANLAARLMTNPTFVKFLATKSNVPLQGLAPTISALRVTANEKKDPDLKAAADIIQQQANQQNQGN